MNVKDKVVIITGSSKGIGLAIAEKLCENGAKVVISSRKQDACDVVAAGLESKGYEAVGIACHVGDLEQRKALVERTISRFGKIDVLINNAAINPVFGPIEDGDEEDWDNVIAVNQTGVFYGMKAALIQMQKQGYGNIINIASLAGLKASPNNISYSASKFAVVGMTKSAAMEYGRKKIRINAICPGYSHSSLLSMMFKYKPELEEGLKSMIPFQRYGEASEIADAAIWLASDKSSYMTGQCLTLDGGLSL
ncbi:UNVERIFIED_CONTAM: hypothetical protein GTU68_030433 [Idotea baltica]|nr:hypothetical protein [Idotea baltica]